MLLAVAVDRICTVKFLHAPARPTHEPELFVTYRTGVGGPYILEAAHASAETQPESIQLISSDLLHRFSLPDAPSDTGRGSLPLDKSRHTLL